MNNSREQIGFIKAHPKPERKIDSIGDKADLTYIPTTNLVFCTTCETPVNIHEPRFAWVHRAEYDERAQGAYTLAREVFVVCQSETHWYKISETRRRVSDMTREIDLEFRIVKYHPLAMPTDDAFKSFLKSVQPDEDTHHAVEQ